MTRPNDYSVPLENVNLKVRIGSLLFDVLVDSTLRASQVIKTQAIHNHAVYELHSIVSGSGTLFIQDREVGISGGDSYLIGPNVFHSMNPQPNDRITHFTIRFSFRDAPHDPWFPSDETRHMKDALSGVAFLPFPNELGQNPVKRWMEDIQAEIQTPSPGYYSNVQGLFTQLFVHIFRTICRKTGTGTEPAQSLPRKLNDELRSRIVDLFFKDFCEPLRIEMLADKLNLSVKQVSRMMQQEYRSTFKQKLIDTRVEAAKHLLRVGELTIQRIAEEVGYANPDNFTRMFIKKTGMTPSRYRVVHCRPNKSSLM